MKTDLRGHQLIEQRSLQFHRAVAGKLRDHPERLEIARENLRRWTALGGPSQPLWDEWRQLLDRPLNELLLLLEENSDRMTVLRRASPFAGVLEPAERWAVYARFAEEFPGSARN